MGVRLPSQLNLIYTPVTTVFDRWAILAICLTGQCVSQLDERPLGEPEIAHVLRQVLKALVYLHGEHRVHRDIKAANVLLSAEGAVKISDFGVSGQLTGSLLLNEHSTLASLESSNPQKPIKWSAASRKMPWCRAKSGHRRFICMKLLADNTARHEESLIGPCHVHDGRPFWGMFNAHGFAHFFT